MSTVSAAECAATSSAAARNGAVRSLTPLASCGGGRAALAVAYGSGRLGTGPRAGSRSIATAIAPRPRPGSVQSLATAATVVREAAKVGRLTGNARTLLKTRNVSRIVQYRAYCYQIVRHNARRSYRRVTTRLDHRTNFAGQPVPHISA